MARLHTTSSKNRAPSAPFLPETKKSPPCRLTERGAIPYNKGREYTATCGLGPVLKYFYQETVTGPWWRFHRFRLMRIVTVQPRICNVMVIGIYSPPFRECSPNRPPLMLVYAWSSGLRGRHHSTINALPCLLLPPGFGGFFCVFQSKSTKRLPTQARNPLRRRGFRAFAVSDLAISLPNVYQGNISR